MLGLVFVFLKYQLFRPDYFRLTLFFQLLLFRQTMSFIAGGFMQYTEGRDNQDSLVGIAR